MTTNAKRIEAAEPLDAETLTRIALAAKRHWGYPEHWLDAWRDALTVRPEFVATHETYSALADGQVVGFYALGRKGDLAELIHLWVLPEWMGQGIGRSLFHHAVERARALGCLKLEIESDPNAEGFYRLMGAVRVGASINAVSGQRRELPVLIYEMERSC